MNIPARRSALPLPLALLCLLLFPLVCAMPAAAAEVAPEKPTLTLAVGGKGLFYYLPLVVAEAKGYFRDAGLDVDIVDFPGGAKSLQALVGGSADVAAGSFEHVVNMRARGQDLQAIALLARYPAIVLALPPKDAASFKDATSLRGRKVGITAPGSSTHLFLNNVLTRAGVPIAEVPVIGVGAGAGAIAAMRRGDIDALVHLDPVIRQLEAAGAAKVVIDTRTLAGAEAVYGGTYHAACLYAKRAFLTEHPRTAAALAGAQVRALQWLATASTDDIVAVVPAALRGSDVANYRAALENNRQIWSADGFLDLDGAEHVIAALAAFEPFVRDAHIEAAALIDNRYGDAARSAAP